MKMRVGVAISTTIIRMLRQTMMTPVGKSAEVPTESSTQWLQQEVIYTSKFVRNKALSLLSDSKSVLMMSSVICWKLSRSLLMLMTLEEISTVMTKRKSRSNPSLLKSLLSFANKHQTKTKKLKSQHFLASPPLVDVCRVTWIKTSTLFCQLSKLQLRTPINLSHWLIHWSCLRLCSRTHSLVLPLTSWSKLPKSKDFYWLPWTTTIRVSLVQVSLWLDLLSLLFSRKTVISTQNSRVLSTQFTMQFTQSCANMTLTKRWNNCRSSLLPI